MAVLVDLELCTGCARCLRACPYQALELAEGKALINERCTLCGTCIEVCPEGALSSDAEEKPIPDFSDHSGVWVLVEHHQGRLHPVSLELLGRARGLAQDLGQEVAALLLGRNVEGLCPALIAGGADTVHLAEHDLLENYLTLPWAKAAARVIRQAKPEILLIGATHQGRDLAPRLARRLGLGLTADCTELAIDPEERILWQTRPAFGGNVMATIASRFSRPQTTTVRPGIMEALRPDPKRTGQVVRHQAALELSELGAVIKGTIAARTEGVDLTKAKIIVSGGRGLGDAEGFGLLGELAGLLGGQVGGTRVAFEAGWIPYERQIGQTGVTVRPELYIACGLSGAIQHRAGILDSRYIVALNKDPGASIFEVADFGLVGDYKVLVPALIQAIKGN